MVGFLGKVEHSKLLLQLDKQMSHVNLNGNDSQIKNDLQMQVTRTKVLAQDLRTVLRVNKKIIVERLVGNIRNRLHKQLVVCEFLI